MTSWPDTAAPARLALLIAALLALLVLPAPALAAPGWTTATDIAGTGSATGLDVAIDRDGDAVMVGSWLATVSTAARTPSGEWSAPEQLTPSGSSPDVAFAPDGSAVAVWAQTTTDWEVWTATRDADGSWSEPELLSAADASVQNPRPTVVIDRAGNATAAWVQTCAVYSARRPANGEWSGPTAIWTDPTPAELGEPCTNYRLETGLGQTFNQPVLDLGVDASGNLTVVWRSGKRSPSTAEKSIRAAVRPAGGSSSWSEARTIAPATLKPRAPRIEVWEDGRAIIAWGIDTLGARAVVRAAGADEPFGSTVTLSETGSPDPVAAYDGHGNATVSWDAPAAGEEPATLQVTTLDGAGTWGPAAPAVSFEEGTRAVNPRLVVSQAGAATLAWTREGGDAPLTETVHQPAGGSWETVTTHGKEESGTSLPALAGDALGNATLAWGGDGLWMGFPSTVARTADFAATPTQHADWTANGLTGTGNLRTWINYLYNGGGGVEASAGAERPDPHDRYSHRLSTSEAWIEQGSGETVVQLQGTIGFKHPSHYIDIRIVDPAIRIAADGKTARLIADGQGSGDMAEAIAGNPQVEPFSDQRLIDLVLPPALPSRDGEVQSWIAAAARIAPGEASRFLSYPAGTAYGFFTFTAPADLPVRSVEPDPDPGHRQPPVAAPPGTVVPPPQERPPRAQAKKCGKGKKKVRVGGKRKCVKRKGVRKKSGKGKRAGAGKR